MPWPAAVRPEAALVEVTITLSPASRPDSTWVALSPTTPVWTRTVERLPSRSTVTVEPRSAWLGTERPLTRATTMSAVALIPALMPSVDWSSVIVTG